MLRNTLISGGSGGGCEREGECTCNPRSTPTYVVSIRPVLDGKHSMPDALHEIGDQRPRQAMITTHILLCHQERRKTCFRNRLNRLLLRHVLIPSVTLVLPSQCNTQEEIVQNPSGVIPMYGWIRKYAFDNMIKRKHDNMKNKKRHTTKHRHVSRPSRIPEPQRERRPRTVVLVKTHCPSPHPLARFVVFNLVHTSSGTRISPDNTDLGRIQLFYSERTM